MYASAGIPTAGVSLRCAKKRGAILQLPKYDSANGASTQRAMPIPATGKRLSRNTIIPPYVARNIKAWHRFARETAHWDVDERDLVFVSGYFETSHWAVAACTDHGIDARVSIQGGHAPLEVSFTIHAAACTSEFFHTKHGPTAPTRMRQCVFLDLYRGKSRNSRLGIMGSVATWRTLSGTALGAHVDQPVPRRRGWSFGDAAKASRSATAQAQAYEEHAPGNAASSDQASDVRLLELIASASA